MAKPAKLFEQILSVETSCDDTSVAIVKQDGQVVYCQSANQDAIHQKFGGVVPEVAGRNHTENLMPMVAEALKTVGLQLKDLDGLAVTNRPGLVGSLLVGVTTVKALALANDLPFVGVNHLEGHLLASFLRDDTHQPPSDFTYPFLGLAVSGGHTSIYNVKAFGSYELLAQTIDDAAGEAFDKFAKMIGLPWPGGAKVDQLAKQGNKEAFDFPRPMAREKNFSFSGLKTAALRKIQTMSKDEVEKNKLDLCASYQEAIVSTLIQKLKDTLSLTNLKRVVITGGVSANSRLREVALDWGKLEGIQVVIPPLRYCTDNAAMIGYAGIQRLNRGERADMELGVSPEVNV